MLLARKIKNNNNLVLVPSNITQKSKIRIGIGITTRSGLAVHALSSPHLVGSELDDHEVGG